MHVRYEMITCSGFREEVQSVHADAGRIPLHKSNFSFKEGD